MYKGKQTGSIDNTGRIETIKAVASNRENYEMARKTINWRSDADLDYVDKAIAAKVENEFKTNSKLVKVEDGKRKKRLRKQYRSYKMLPPICLRKAARTALSDVYPEKYKSLAVK